MKNEIKAIGRVSNASVLKGSGKGWSQWIAILEKAGARQLTHKEISALLKRKYKLTFWWQHSVAYGFELHIGRKLEGQNEKGLYSVTATKSFPIGGKEAWDLATSSEGLKAWLNPLSDFDLKPKESFEVEGGFYGEVRTMKAPRRVRLSLKDGESEKATYIQLHVVPKPKNKSIVAISHEGLKSPREKAAMASRWRAALVRLLALL